MLLSADTGGDLPRDILGVRNVEATQVVAPVVASHPHSHQRHAQDEADDGRDVEETPEHGSASR
jgi:hypothetical protein